MSDNNDKQITLLFSQEAADKVGTVIGTVPAEDGTRKTVHHTIMVAQGDEAGYGYKDPQTVWQGPKSDWKYVGNDQKHKDFWSKRGELRHS